MGRTCQPRERWPLDLQGSTLVTEGYQETYRTTAKEVGRLCEGELRKDVEKKSSRQGRLEGTRHGYGSSRTDSAEKTIAEANREFRLLCNYVSTVNPIFGGYKSQMLLRILRQVSEVVDTLSETMHSLMQCWLLLTIAANCVCASDSSKFGYSKEDGPSTWTGTCRTGTRQSPVDINPMDVDTMAFGPLHFVNYAATERVIVHNNGHTVMVSGFEDWGNLRPYMYSGGLTGGIYDLVQLHFHWSQNRNTGSEHTLRSVQYPGEIHLVHVKRGRRLDDGLPYANDTIAVLAVFFTLGNNAVPFSSFENAFRLVVDPGDTADTRVKLMELLPANQAHFYRYEGSLTTPTCDEAVVWTVMAEPIFVTPSQMTALQNVKLDSGTVGENFRPTQPLNGRRIKYRSPYSSVYRSQQLSEASASSAELPRVKPKIAKNLKLSRF